MIKFILMDVEGTTTDIKFVKNELFPFARKRMTEYVSSNFNSLLDEAAALGIESPEELAELLIGHIDQDKKDPLLKKVQGAIWKEGYDNGELKGHVYSEVAQKLKEWKDQGLELGIYSSGSVAAQKLLYSHSLAGDLTVYLSRHFDLKVGHKREAQSYQAILKELPHEPEEVLFLSDIEEELDAAQKAGMKTGRLFRGDKEGTKHPSFSSFEQIDLEKI